MAGKLVQVNVYMPIELVEKIDKDRGIHSRSGYISTMAEMYYAELESYEQNEEQNRGVSREQLSEIMMN